MAEFLKALLELLVKDPKSRTNIIQLALLALLCLGIAFAPPRSNSSTPAKNRPEYEVKMKWVPDSPVSKDPFYKLPDQSQNN
jgi:hypothetical protein